MKFNSLFCILLFFSVQLFAQTESKILIVKDKETDLPIEDVTITIMKTKQNMLSNNEGIVIISLTGNSLISIKHSSYIATTIRSNSLNDTPTIVYLTSNVNELDDIIITKKHPQKILASLIENSKKKLTVPGRLKVYCREFFKLNGNYSYYNDGLLNFQLLDKARKADAVILVEQNRSINLTTNYVEDDLLGYNLNDIMENYYDFKYLGPLLNAVAKKEYDFIVKVFSKNKDYNIMVAVPNENATGLLDDFSIIYDPDKKIIIEVSSVVSPITLSKIKDKTSNGAKNVYKSMFKTIYKLNNGMYYLLGSKEEIGFEKIEKGVTKEIEVRNYFLTQNFSTNYFKYKEEDVFKAKTLHNKKNVILTDFWNECGLMATQDEQQIVNIVEKTN